MSKKQARVFTDKFLWGASTASHQVEGGTENQWSVWEQANAQHLAKTADRRLNWIPGYERFRKQASTPSNYVSGRGVDHYRRYKDDFKLLKQLNLNSFRFGIEWSRIEPEQGVWNIEAIEHYKNYIRELDAMGIEPVLNLWHWTMPTWFTDRGGFEKASNSKYFVAFVEKMCQELPIKKVAYIITLNEPNVYATFGYTTGEWVPNVKNPLRFMRVYWNLIGAHRGAYRVIKRYNPKAQIGVAQQLANIQPKRPQNLLDSTATKWMRYFWNWWFLNRIKNYQDYVGFNYYFTDYYRFGSLKELLRGRFFYQDNPQLPKNDLGWYMEPEGLHALLVRVHAHYKKPIMITENGLADAEDTYRKWWIEETIVAMERALSEGVPLIGYMHWSLLDNFEWAYGWWPKFGLVHVDRKTMRRTIRPSAKYYADIAKRYS